MCIKRRRKGLFVLQENVRPEGLVSNSMYERVDVRVQVIIAVVVQRNPIEFLFVEGRRMDGR